MVVDDSFCKLLEVLAFVFWFGLFCFDVSLALERLVCFSVAWVKYCLLLLHFVTLFLLVDLLWLCCRLLLFVDLLVFVVVWADSLNIYFGCG